MGYWIAIRGACVRQVSFLLGELWQMKTRN